MSNNGKSGRENDKQSRVGNKLVEGLALRTGTESTKGGSMIDANEGGDGEVPKWGRMSVCV